MKKEYKYLILVLVIMFGFQFSVLADTITDDGNWHDVAGISNNNGLDCSCNSDAVTCETYDTTNGKNVHVKADKNSLKANTKVTMTCSGIDANGAFFNNKQVTFTMIASNATSASSTTSEKTNKSDTITDDGNWHDVLGISFDSSFSSVQCSCSGGIKPITCEAYDSTSEKKIHVKADTGSISENTQIGMTCTGLSSDNTMLKKTATFTMVASKTDPLADSDIKDATTDSTKTTTDNSADVLNLCDASVNPQVMAAFKLGSILILIVKIIVPILLIIFGMIDMSKAVVESNQDAIKKNAVVFAKRIGAGVLVFFAPTILLIIFDFVDSWDNIESTYKNCIDCLFDVDKCPENVSIKQS